jgi:hypothetical protein
MTVNKVRLIQWNAAEAQERVELLRAAGYEVIYQTLSSGADLKELTEDLPAAVVIDLGRLPSHGRDLALMLRQRKTTRHVPLILIGGDQDKVTRIKSVLPDAVYTTWNNIRSSLEHAIAHPPTDPIVPRSNFEAYSGTPLPKKLGIKANSAVALLNAPKGFKDTLGQLPEGATLLQQVRDRCHLIIWFTKSRKDLVNRIESMAQTLPDNCRLWIAWPKKTSGVTSDISEKDVREVGLAAGLVDYKICAIDETWSGLLFSRRKPN